jgi:hypothetical protein
MQVLFDNGTGRWRLIQRVLARVSAAVASARPGRITEVEVPDEFLD